MNTKTRISNAERFGLWLGHCWLSYVGSERSAVRWMASWGIPGAVAAALLWVVRLTVLALLLYVAFWLVLLLVLLMLVAHGYKAGDLAEPEAEWRDGHVGFGLYTKDEHRIDPHDPNDPYNT